jgi:hypothetical protein
MTGRVGLHVATTVNLTAEVLAAAGRFDEAVDEARGARGLWDWSERAAALIEDLSRP